MGFKEGFGRTERRREGPQRAEESRAGDWDVSESLLLFPRADPQGRGPGVFGLLVWLRAKEVSVLRHVHPVQTCVVCPHPSRDAPGGSGQPKYLRAREGRGCPPRPPTSPPGIRPQFRAALELQEELKEEVGEGEAKTNRPEQSRPTGGQGALGVPSKGQRCGQASELRRMGGGETSGTQAGWTGHSMPGLPGWSRQVSQGAGSEGQRPRSSVTKAP